MWEIIHEYKNQKINWTQKSNNIFVYNYWDYMLIGVTNNKIQKRFYLAGFVVGTWHTTTWHLDERPGALLYRMGTMPLWLYI